MAKSHCHHRKKVEEILDTKDSCRKKTSHFNEVINENIIDPVCCIKADPPCEDIADLTDSNDFNNTDNDMNEEPFSHYLENYLGQTVTIFTTSGGQSGSGFTGVLMSIECNFLRLLSQIGPAPGCALGNCCSNSSRLEIQSYDCSSNQEENASSNCKASSIGSVVVIPLSSIAAFVHNAVGSNL